MGLLLALDTGTAVGGVALVEEGRILVSRSFAIGRQHSRRLLAEIDEVMQLADRGPQDLDAVGVAIGPGSYTGLRIGLGAAKGICMGSGAALVTVPSLEALAARVPLAPHPVCATLDSRRGEIYAALYDTSEGRPVELEPPKPFAPDELVAQRAGKATVYTGESVQTYAEAFAKAEEALWAPAECGRADAGVVGVLAAERYGRGQRDDVATAEPEYLRLPSYLRSQGG